MITNQDIEKIRATYIDGNRNRHIVPKRFHKFYVYNENKEEFEISDREYKDLLEFFIKVDTLISSIYLDEDYIFKGIGYYGKEKVAFFGERYGATKYAIKYRDFRKKQISSCEKQKIKREVEEFFRKSNGNHIIENNN